MKRAGGLYEQVVSFPNLLEAARRARRGKRKRPDVAEFHYNLEGNLLRIRHDLQSGEYIPGAYRTFAIVDPKPRLISAAPYRDRVVHHALCRVIEPIFDRTFIFDSFANRLDKGTHRAINRCTEFCRRYRYVLKCDIARYFPSVDHLILKERIERTIKCPMTLNLMRVIIDASNPPEEGPNYFVGDNLFTPVERRYGIPIGNLTSQLFGNIYLNGFDHWIKQEVGASGYIRFVDDFLVFSDSRRWLHEILPRIHGYMDTLRLKLHPRKCQVMPVRCGVEFLGWHVFPEHRRLRRSTGVRFQRRIQDLAEGYHSGELSLQNIRPVMMSWLGHLQHGDTWRLRTKLLETGFSRGNERMEDSRSEE